jgi:hypothetical protein
MVAVNYFEVMVITCETKWCHNPEVNIDTEPKVTLNCKKKGSIRNILSLVENI